ncbi:MAG: hypothetical protein IAE79_20905 [Anaerolinea sp.]|nr:hypothetical protein [Anaerolinea sp.]
MAKDLEWKRPFAFLLFSRGVGFGGKRPFWIANVVEGKRPFCSQTFGQ